MKLVKPDAQGLKQAADAIHGGGVVVYPTETVYGLGCLPSSPKATRRVCTIKERTDNPLPLIASSTEQAQRIVLFNPAAKKLAQRFWPGPLTLVLPSKVRYPIWVTQGMDTLAVRVSGYPLARELAERSGGVIVSTSANRTGMGPYTRIMDVAREIGEEVDVLIDDGDTPGEAPSTVLDLTGTEPRVLRSGPVTLKEILETLG